MKLLCRIGWSNFQVDVVSALKGECDMREVLFEVKDQSGSILLDIKYNQNEVDSMTDVARKQHARWVLSSGQPRSLPLSDSATLYLSLVGK